MPHLASRAPFTLAERLYEGQSVLMPWIGLPDPLYADALAREDFD
jgi:2-keto-3-deoxy-L-rhamnonate aldolase RhmA